MLEKRLITKILETYTLSIYGIHGVPHWARVLQNGRKLAEHTGADLKVVSLFAVLHDSKRFDEGVDYEHGPMAAEFIDEIRNEYLPDLSGIQFDLLYEACNDHTKGKIRSDITVQTCWDADRLDLGRVGILPAEHKLCTEYAKRKETIEWADNNAVYNIIPDFVRREWGIEI